MQLTEAQASMVEQNHNLIYVFLQKRGLSEENADDWYGVAALGLCKAAMHFDESKGCKFSTLAFVCMENEIRMEMRKMKRQPPSIESLELECFSHEGEDCGTLEDHLSIGEDFRDCIAIQDAFERVLKSFSNRDREIIKLYYFENLKQRNIAQIYKIAGSGVSKIIGRFNARMRRALSK